MKVYRSPVYQFCKYFIPFNVTISYQVRCALIQYHQSTICLLPTAAGLLPRCSSSQHHYRSSHTLLPLRAYSAIDAALCKLINWQSKRRYLLSLYTTAYSGWSCLSLAMLYLHAAFRPSCTIIVTLLTRLVASPAHTIVRYWRFAAGLEGRHQHKSKGATVYEMADERA